MKRILGGFFYAAAALYLVASKSPDLITLVAIIACVLLAGFSVTRHSYWAAIGGGILVAGSLFLQSLLSFRCIDCIRADIMILAGVAVLSIMNQGPYRRTLKVLSVVITTFVTFTLAVHYDPSAVFGFGKGLVVDEAVAACPEAADRHVSVFTPDDRKMTMDITEKPVLFFSPNCGACIRAVESLAQADPEGTRWVPVQSYGDWDKGRKLLEEKGYRGESYIYASEWHGAVPVMVTAGKNGWAVKTSSPQEMLRIVRGDAG